MIKYPVNALTHLRRKLKLGTKVPWGKPYCMIIKVGTQPNLKGWVSSFLKFLMFAIFGYSPYSCLGLETSKRYWFYLGVNQKNWHSANFKVLSRKFKLGTKVPWDESWCLVMKIGTQPSLKCWVSSFCQNVSVHVKSYIWAFPVISELFWGYLPQYIWGHQVWCSHDLECQRSMSCLALRGRSLMTESESMRPEVMS